MSYKPRSLFRLFEEVNSHLFLPHIQRPFVWDEDQMCRLFDSLMRNYPIQTFLFWRTTDEIKARKFMAVVDRDIDLHDLYDEPTSHQGCEKVFVLDGQQRIQTLYALFHGAIKSPDGRTNLEAYVDITSGHSPDEDGLLHRVRFSDESLELPYFRLCDLLGKHAQRNAEEIADDINDRLEPILSESPDETKSRERLVRRNISQLVSLLREEKHFWVQELDGVASEFPYKRVLDIFVRVNSGGTKLDAADLMFAAMKEGWADVEEKIEETVELLNDGLFGFDKSFALKCVVVAHDEGADLGPEKFASATGEALLKKIEDNWDAIEETFKQLRDFVVNELRIYGDKVVRSYLSFVPLFDYLYHNPKPNEQSRTLMRGYYYKSQLFNWYGARTDNIINVMHGYVGAKLEGGFPLADIKVYFAKQPRDTELRPEHLLNMRLRYMILNLIYVEKFGTSPFNVRFKGNEPHIDHIYPQSMLRSRLGLSSEEINSIGNFRFVGATDNIRKRAELPDSYFTRLHSGGVDIEKHLLVPEFSAAPATLKFDVVTYRSFRDQRLERIYDVAHRVVNPELPSAYKHANEEVADGPGTMR